MKNLTINDWELVEGVKTFFKGDADLAQDWLEMFSDFGDVPLSELVEPAAEFAIENELPFRVLDAIDQNEDGEVTWIIERQ
jgi:hypothetical protein